MAPPESAVNIVILNISYPPFEKKKLPKYIASTMPAEDLYIRPIFPMAGPAVLPMTIPFPPWPLSAKPCSFNPRRGPDLFLPFAYYKDYTPGSSLPGMGPRDYQLDPRSLVCYRRMVPLSQYAVERISAICGVPQIQMRPCSGELLQKKALLFQQEASQKLEKNVLTEAGKFQFRFQQNNMVYDGYFATILAKAPKESSGGSPDVMDLLKKGMAFMGAMYGIGGMESFDWGRSFDLLLVYPHVEKDSYEVIFDKFLAELRYAPLYFALQDEELRNTQQIQIQGAMQRQQNAIRSSQQISRTLSETSDIVNQGIHDHSRQMDRIYDRSSDGIRGVNTYTDSTGRGYEADVGYEHIYRHNDTFVGSKDGSLQLGPEWEELERH